jgi:hypothetical protein
MEGLSLLLSLRSFVLEGYSPSGAGLEEQKVKARFYKMDTEMLGNKHKHHLRYRAMVR